MSTNYYWHEPPCAAPCTHCPGPTVLHIGKSSFKSYSFEAHFRGQNPLDAQITSWQDWKAFLVRWDDNGGEILDEYQQQVPVAEFIEMIEAVDPLWRRRQYDWLDARRDQYGDQLGKVEPYCDWLDADGFSFHGGDFS